MTPHDAPRRTRPFGRRLAAGFILALAVLVGPVGGAPVAAAGTGVSFQIDHGAKTITATIKLTLTPACTANQMAAAAMQGTESRCRVSQAIADDIKANIEQVWNGHKYYCYDIVVNVDVAIDNNPNNPDPTDRHRVQIDQSPATIRSFVRVTRGAGATWDGNSPGDQLQAVNQGTSSSTWGYPRGPHRPYRYAHEAGHVLGLDDTYEDAVDVNGQTVAQPRPGAPIDIMNSTATDHVDRVTTDRLAERAGARKADLKCNYKLDQPTMGGRITGLKCDPLGGSWIADGSYSFAGADGDQTWIIEINADTKRGTFTYVDNQVMEAFAGIKVFTEGKASGEATLTIDDELRARIHLKEEQHTYKSTTTKGGKGSDVNAPRTSIDLVWEPIGRCPA